MVIYPGFLMECTGKNNILFSPSLNVRCYFKETHCRTSKYSFPILTRLFVISLPSHTVKGIYLEDLPTNWMYSAPDGLIKFPYLNVASL